MGTLIQERLSYETDAWKRLLEFISRENSFLLDHLSLLLKENNDPEFVINAEYFQSAFINEYERIRMLRQEIEEYERLLKPGSGKEVEEGKVALIHSRVKSHISDEEAAFLSLRISFDRYLDSLVL